jgi:phenylpropionate dioxygenase-like ring-hydroxylating dioxygenase large terminal subunit
MKTLILPSFYSDPHVFERERRILFQKLWNFAGLTTDLENHNDYICKEIGGKSIVIQNFQGELRAFDNVCSHRFSRIRQDPQGNGSLQCPYHGWIYSKDGIPVGIPHQQGFDEMSDCLKESLKLEEWLVEKCGLFIFIKRFDDGINLKSFLGGIYDKIIEFSEAIGQKADCYQTSINANWKIVVENTLESYHVWFVHANSLAKNGPVEEQYYLHSPHSTYFSKPQKTDKKWQRFISNFSDRKLHIDGYQHYLVFPLLTLATFSGMSLSIHSMNPLSPLETKVTNYTFMGRLNDSRLEQILFDMNSQSTANLTRQTWSEDQPICEQVQLGISSIENRSGIFNREEQRVYEFHKAYVNLMNSQEV